MNADALTELHASLDARRRPEDVAEAVMRAIGQEMDREDRGVLRRVSRWSLAERQFWTAMSDDFERADDGAGQAEAVRRLFGRSDELDPAEATELHGLAAGAGAEISWDPARTDFKADRMNRAERAAAGFGDLSKRQYNRRFRALARLERKAGRVGVQTRRRELTMFARSGFAREIPLERFLADPSAAAFVAYFTARKNLRRQFTLDAKENPFDEVAAMLLARCEAAPACDWGMIALARPTQDVLARLGDGERGELLGRYSALMRETALELGGLWEAGDYDRERMIVSTGNDSSTWNALVGAYNAARTGWIALLTCAGALSLLDLACPGKALRLMAADLAYWHVSEDGDVDDDTRVWAALPLPWQVLSGSESATRAQVEAICRELGVDPVARGWTAPRALDQIAEFRPTPELVHGVSIADPAWAMLLRSAGVFSGRGGRPFRPERSAQIISGLEAGVVVSELPQRGTGA